MMYSSVWYMHVAHLVLWKPDSALRIQWPEQTDLKKNSSDIYDVFQQSFGMRATYPSFFWNSL